MDSDQQACRDGKCDLIIDNALVMDGSGAAGFKADVAVESGRIAAVGSLTEWTAQERIDAGGLVLAPGFIDVHTHDDLEILNNPALASKVSQGVTTVIAGNCGISAAPLRHCKSMPPPFPLLGKAEEFVFPQISDYCRALDDARPAVNLALLVGHSSLRLNVMREPLQRPATAVEIVEMSEQLGRALAAGCIGMSSGLDYPPASEAPMEEMISLARILRQYPASVYTTHMRDESDGVVDAVKETLRTGREAGVSVIISHHKCAGPANYGRSKETLDLICSAQATQHVALDAYPYTASSTSLLPRFVRGAEKILVAYSEPYPEFACRPLHEIAEEWGCSAVCAAERLYPAGAIYFQMDEGDLRRILAYPSTMIGSDGLPGMPHPHPRLWGTFPRVLARYVREQALLTMEEAIHKMTGLSARTFNLTDRGFVRSGHHADLVLFDPDTVADTATFENPEQTACGIRKVLVNGVIAWSDGVGMGRRAGVFLGRN